MIILFVCGANVGRSQVAEAYFNHFSKKNKAISAGVEDHGRDGMSKDMKTLLAQEGISTENQMPKLLTEEMVNIADRIFLMCSARSCPTYLIDSGKTQVWDIEDAKDKDIHTKKIIKNQIKEKVIKLIEKIG